MLPKRSRLILILLAATALLTAPYWVFQARLLHLCSASCSVSGILLYFSNSQQSEPRLTGCINDTDVLLSLFSSSGTTINPHARSHRSTHVHLQQPVSASVAGLSPACTSIFTDPDPAAPSPDARPLGQCFNMSYSVSDQAAVYPVLHQLEQNFTQRGLEIFLIGGSLLGSARHFGFIPWDDDVDFMVRREQKPEVRALLVELSARDEFYFVDTEQINQHWRLGILCTRDPTKPAQQLYGTNRFYPVKQCKMSVDLFFGHVSGELYVRQESPFYFPLRDVYPLTERPFGTFMMRAPRNAEAVLAVEYQTDYHARCVFQIHSDRFRCHRKLLRCSRLRPFYPFVTRLQLRQPGSGEIIHADVLAWRSQLHAIFIPAH